MAPRSFASGYLDVDQGVSPGESIVFNETAGDLSQVGEIMNPIS